ncbi:diguanylate cyclase [Alteraurantiacibacter buctensis]|uniref:diguanylate cyclase n=1 Tax=Alteraurantiacibacter buctensis TaxID=1503981 RepID=A0A844Z0X0_9SPHN|nr:diguanylate cyclase [Alteraurantiacibacter buctensis]
MKTTFLRLATWARKLVDRRSTLGSARLLLVTMVLLGAMLAGSGYLAREATEQQRQAEKWQERTFAVIDNLSSVRVAVLSIRRGERGFLLTGDPAFLDPYTAGIETLDREVPEMRELLAESRQQAERVDQLTVIAATFVSQAQRTVALQRAGRHEEAVAASQLTRGRQLTNRVMAMLDQIEAVERQLMEQRENGAATAARRSDDFQGMLMVSGLALLAIGAYSSQALRLAIQREQAIRAELDRIATTDELTGLANRREMFTSLDRMIATARRSGRPLSVAILDLDRFKQVNDTHGHPAGDEVLRRVAEMARLLLRQQDLVGRLGGEEFLIAFPDCPAHEAVAACERLRQGIAALPVLLPSGVGLSVTVSTGVAQFDPSDDRKTVISRADEALYRAKKGGRDQVRLAA